MPGQHTEYAFETAIEYHLTEVSKGYKTGNRESFALDRAIFPADCWRSSRKCDRRNGTI